MRRTLPDVVFLKVPMSPFGDPFPTDQYADIELRHQAWLDLFTNKSRSVMRLAQASATQLNHDFIGTEHILLGLIQEEEGIAAKALESLGVSLSKVHEQVVANSPGRTAPRPARIDLAERAKNALELSLQEARQLGSSYIDTEHILLGLIREGGRAARMLAKLGADFARVHQHVIELLSGVPGATERHHWGKVVREIKDAFPRVGIVALLPSDEAISDLATSALQAGAAVYVSVGDSCEKMVAALKVAANLNKPEG